MKLFFSNLNIIIEQIPAMSSQIMNTSFQKNHKSQIKDQQVSDLMKSIENKLSMLACDNSVVQFQQSKMEQSPKREYLTATNEKKTKNRMNIQDLETSHRKQTKQSPSRLGQSRILSRINEMQHYYMDKIQQMSSKLASLQTQLQTLTKQNYELKNQNILMKQMLNRKQKQQNQSISKKLEQAKSQLIQKFAKEAQQHFQQHIKQMRAINDELMQEKGKRKYLQQQVGLLKTEKSNLEEFYKNLLENHRQMIKMDIVKSQKSQKQHSAHSAVVSKGDEQQSSGTKKRKRKQKVNSTKRSSEQMTKQQMIPFLAKGIQDLKDKLKIK